MMSDSDIEKFLFREARLMDEHRYEEWLTLWTGRRRVLGPLRA